MTGRAEVVVIGGGPAGAAAAIRLAEAGRHVLVLERARGAQHKVCGEFVSAEAVEALEGLGLHAAALGAAPLERVRLTGRGRSAEAALPFRAAGLSRRRLDEALLARARAAGAEVRFGAAVRHAADPKTVVLTEGGVVRGDTLLLATGKHDLHGRRRATPWRRWRAMLGLKMHLGGAPVARLGRRIELHLFPGGCAGLQPVEGAANLCITTTADLYARSGGFEGLLAAIGAANPAFAAAMDGAEPLWPKPLAIARVPYGHLRRPGEEPTFWCLGDQAAVTPSFTGDGLAIALRSGLLAAETLVVGGSRAGYEARFRRTARRQLRPAMRLQALLDRPAAHRPALALARCLPGILAMAARRTRLR